MKEIDRLKKLIKDSENIVFFGGAGTSTESGIPDFRSAKTGLYNKNYEYQPEEILSHSFFFNKTNIFYDFYKKHMIYMDAKPNYLHKTLFELEKKNKLKVVITQNIDGLHQLAGSKNVLELHGSINKNICLNCNEQYDLEYIYEYEGIPKCKICSGLIKPKVVLYEESLNQTVLNKSIDYIKNADVLIVGGTSLVVYPAAGLIEYYNGDKLILVNKSITSYDNRANLIIKDNISEVFKKILDDL
ncbi:NAD-dependent protein deacylase [Peptostreptococcaceae bacterium AGR-M142]